LEPTLDLQSTRAAPPLHPALSPPRGKRTLTNDFATVVHRIKLLGFNAVRLPFQ
jgi:hypothetical protein